MTSNKGFNIPKNQEMKEEKRQPDYLTPADNISNERFRLLIYTKNKEGIKNIELAYMTYRKTCIQNNHVAKTKNEWLMSIILESTKTYLNT